MSAKEMTMTPQSDAPTSRPLAWSAVLGATAILGSYALACIFPFAAVATIAALTLRGRAAAALVAAAWSVNQIVGFGLRGYPHTLDTVGWGVAIGVGAFGALAAARRVAGRSPQILSARTPVALVAAFVAYEALLFTYAQFAGGIETFSADIVAQIAITNAYWFAGLAALHVVLTQVALRRFARSLLT